jgi:hypothetical protein
MGQPITKLTNRFIMPKISKAIESHERVMAQDALDDIARKKAMAGSSKYTDPSALQGFKRDTWRDDEMIPQEHSQRQFLQQNNQAGQEMPDDLLKFLNDKGPVTKNVDKALTSPKVYDSLQVEEEQRRQQDQQQNQRRLRRMPIIGDMDTAPGEDTSLDGTTVEKTTNFSTAVKNTNDAELRLTDREMFDLVSKLQAGAVKPETYVRDKLKALNVSEVDPQTKDTNIELIQNVMRYYAIPTLMQDTDKSIVGAWSGEHVNDLKKLGVRKAPENIRLFYEKEQKDTKRQEPKTNTRQSIEDFLHQEKKSM